MNVNLNPGSCDRSEREILHDQVFAGFCIHIKIAKVRYDEGRDSTVETLDLLPGSRAGTGI